MSFPVALAVDEDGLVYVVDTTKDRVLVKTPDNVVVSIIPVPSPRTSR